MLNGFPQFQLCEVMLRSEDVAMEMGSIKHEEVEEVVDSLVEAEVGLPSEVD